MFLLAQLTMENLLNHTQYLGVLHTLLTTSRDTCQQACNQGGLQQILHISQHRSISLSNWLTKQMLANASQMAAPLMLTKSTVATAPNKTSPVVQAGDVIDEN